MKKLKLLMGIFMCLGWVGVAHAADWVSPRDYQIDYPLNIAGTLQRGVSNVTEPKPVKSRFFQVLVGGVSLTETGAHLVLKVSRLEPLPQTAVVRVEYANPQNPRSPIVEEAFCDPAETEHVFFSPEVIWGLRGYYSHPVKVIVYEKAGDEQPIDALTQNIRSYVDTQDRARILVFKKILNAAGIRKIK